jgi:hypothetical protein
VSAGVAERFDREMGCSVAEWRRWLLGAVEEGRVLALGASSAEVAVDAGRLHVSWRALPARQLGLLRVPRLWVSFRFKDVTSSQREAFMRRLDLHTQRGGG